MEGRPNSSVLMSQIVPSEASACKRKGLRLGKTCPQDAVWVVTPNDSKLSDTPERRGACMVGGKAAVEAGAVTRRRVRCSAWLGVGVAVWEDLRHMVAQGCVGAGEKATSCRPWSRPVTQRRPNLTSTHGLKMDRRMKAMQAPRNRGLREKFR